MQTSSSRGRLIRQLLAILFAACATTYSVLWILHNKHTHPQPGFTNYEYSPTNHAMKVGEVQAGSPADLAGLRPGDLIVAIDGHELTTLRPFYDSIIAGNKVSFELTVERPGPPAGQQRLRVVTFGGNRVPARTARLADLLGFSLDYYPVGFLVVGVTVLLLRTDDGNAWLLALLFGGFLAAAPLFEGNIPAPLRGFVVCYKVVTSWCAIALFYYFFAVFPASSPLDRKVPWLKYALVAGAIIATFPIGLRCLIAGGSLPLYLDTSWPGTKLMTWFLTVQAGLPSPAFHGFPSPGVLFFGPFLLTVTLGLVSLLSNDFLSADAQVRRKAHMMLWGTVIGVAPVSVCVAALMGESVHVPLVLWQISVLLLLSVWPLSFAYAVVKYRVLEIPALLKHSARYVLVQRGYFVLLFVAAVTAIALFTHTISRFFPNAANIGMAVSAVFGIVMVW
ncbi:MAG: PDZ domain-containing protein, partial [Acidobacteriaceae bacterium]|nr:PDZ domain-containing protein [Acidobacteriaceae bacterium]